MEEVENVILDRSFLEWEWYEDLPTRVVFIHILFKSMSTDKKRCGKVVERGSLITTRDKLKNETGLSEQQVRSALENLKSTGHIKTEASNKHTVITISEYCNYQMNNNFLQNNQQTTDNTTTEVNGEIIEVGDVIEY